MADLTFGQASQPVSIADASTGDFADVVTSTKRLKVDALISSSGGPPSLSKKVRFVDMNASNGGVARSTTIGATYTTVFSYSGSGLWMGFLITLNNIATGGGWDVQVLIDGDNLMADMPSGGINTVDMSSTTVYNYNTAGAWDPSFFESEMRQETLRFGASPYPIAYSSDVVIKVKKSSGSDTFLAGLVLLTKET